MIEGAADLSLHRMASATEVATSPTLLRKQASIVTGTVIPDGGGASIVNPGTLGMKGLKGL